MAPARTWLLRVGWRRRGLIDPSEVPDRGGSGNSSADLGWRLAPPRPAGRSAPPTLQGEPAAHLFSVPGVVNNGLATVFACTNVSSGNIIVGVEVFGPAGGAALNDASATSLTIGSSGTAMFGTKPMVGFSIDSALGVGLVVKGSARVLATARSGIICSAIVTDPLNSPPVAIASLSIVKKTTQQGD